MEKLVATNTKRGEGQELAQGSSSIFAGVGVSQRLFGVESNSSSHVEAGGESYSHSDDRKEPLFRQKVVCSNYYLRFQGAVEEPR